jgi:hypothetical protein
MNTINRTSMTILLAISLLLGGCGMLPTIKPAVEVRPTARALTAADLSAAGLTPADLPAGYAALSASDFQDMQKLTSIVMTDFPGTQVVGFSAYGKTLDSGQFEAIVVGFYFTPLSEQDIVLFDNPDLAGKTFAHGAGYIEQITGYGSAGEYSATLSLSMQSIRVDELVARRGNVGFAAMVLSGDGTTRLDLAAATAKILDQHIQSLLSE